MPVGAAHPSARFRGALLPPPRINPSLLLLVLFTWLSALSHGSSSPTRSPAPDTALYSGVQCSTLPHEWPHGEGGTPCITRKQRVGRGLQPTYFLSRNLQLDRLGARRHAVSFTSQLRPPQRLCRQRDTSTLPPPPFPPLPPPPPVRSLRSPSPSSTHTPYHHTLVAPS